MATVLIKSRWYSRADVMKAGPIAKALFIDAVCYAALHETFPRIDIGAAVRLCDQFDDLQRNGYIHQRDEPIEDLIEAGLLTKDGESFVINGRDIHVIGDDK